MPAVHLQPRSLLAVVLLAGMALGLWSPGRAWAHNVDGKLGLGFEETLTAVGGRQLTGTFGGNKSPDVRAAGLTMRYYSGHWGFEGIAGFGVHFPGGDERSELAGFASVGALYNVFRAPSVNFAVGLRALVGVARTNDGDEAGDLRFGLAFEAPLRVEYFFSPAFAVGAAVGPTLAVPWFLAGRVHPLTGGADAQDLSLTRGDFSGGLGFTYYF